MFNTSCRTKVEDLAGMKVRTGGGISEEMGRALGTSAFVDQHQDRRPASQVADGTFFPSEAIVSFKLGPVIKYATLFPGGFYSSAFGFFMNEDQWNKLSEDRAPLPPYRVALARLAGRSWDTADDAGIQEMKKAGIRIDEASPAFVKGVEERVKPLEQKWVQAATAKGIDGARVLAEFRGRSSASPPASDAGHGIAPFRGRLLARSRAGSRRGHRAVRSDGADDGERRRPLFCQLAAAWCL